MFAKGCYNHTRGWSLKVRLCNYGHYADGRGRGISLATTATCGHHNPCHCGRFFKVTIGALFLFNWGLELWDLGFCRPFHESWNGECRRVRALLSSLGWWGFGSGSFSSAGAVLSIPSSWNDVNAQQRAFHSVCPILKKKIVV